MRTGLALGCLLLGLLVARGATPASAAAEENSREERMTLRVGKPKLWSPGYPCMMIICDDPSVVRVEDAGTKLRLTGLRPGSTRCGFWRDQAYRRLISIDVLADHVVSRQTLTCGTIDRQLPGCRG